MISARFCASLRPESSITGTSCMPSFRAASSRPWPAMMPFLPSTRIGLVQPNSRMEAAISATCRSEWVRAFLANGISPATGR
jgi:hypothetical protein